MSLLQAIMRQAITQPRRLAVIDDRRTYTYAQLIGGAMFLAERIEATTDRPHVGILLPTSGAFPMALLASWMCHRAAVAYNYLLNKEELAYVVKDSGVSLIITSRAMLEHLGGPELIPPGISIIYMEDLDVRGLPPLRFPPFAHPDQIAVLLYTSGTSGKPKGVVLTHGNLESNARGGIAHARLTEADTFLGVLPQFHSFGLTGLTLIPLIAGSTVVYSARFVPRRVVAAIREHRPAVIMAVPSMYAALLSVKDACADDFKSVRLAVSGAEPLPQTVSDQVRDRLGFQILEGYGLTETSPIVSWSTDWAWRRKSVGTPIPGVEVLIVDERDRPQPRGVSGEILVAGPNIMKGYHNLVDSTSATIIERCVEGFRSNRWFRTGDLGKVDDDGFIFITGRKKEMLKVAGEMVIPREIEEVLARHPSVKDAAVIGKRDDVRGEVPVAFIEIKEGQAFDEQTLRNWCRENLAAFKVPRDFRLIDALPRSATGKVLRRELKAE